MLKESNGIEVMPKQAFLRAWVKDIVRFVLCAVKNILPSKHGKSIVVMLVKQEREFAIGLTLKKGIVLFAIKSLNVIDMLLKKHAVKNVRTFQPDTPREVYDIEVEHDHCYYIDGSLVSNSHACDALRYLCLSLPKLRNVSDPVLLEQRYNEARYGSSTNLPKMFQDNLPPY